MPRQNSFLNIFLNHSPKFQVFGIILSSNKSRWVEGVSFNPPKPRVKTYEIKIPRWKLDQG